jgi:hypothetical protein
VSDQICFTIDFQEICIPIPSLLSTSPVPRELIDGWIQTNGPSPDPWRTDLPIVATAAALADLAEDRTLAEALSDVARFYADKMAGQIPEGARVEIHEVLAARQQ